MLGSPPRVRGKLTEDRAQRLRPGITPACAGKTKREAITSAAAEDHPRVCGENTSEMAYFRG